VLLEQRAQRGRVVDRQRRRLHVLRVQHRGVAVEQVDGPAGHAGPEVEAGRAEHGRDAARHVLEGVRLDALDDDARAAALVRLAQADAEAVAAAARDVGAAGAGAVAERVADERQRRRLAVRGGRSGTITTLPPYAA
jgi:hypothetical protein